MKALVYVAPKSFEVQSFPDPKAESHEELIRVESAGICGSDMHAFLGHDERRIPPLILGHEIAGVIASGKNEGQEVVVNPLISCHNCSYCLEGYANLCPNRTMLGMQNHGGFAEYVVAPIKNILPTTLEAHKAALAEPAATVVHALKLIQNALWRPLPEAKTLVIGGGAIGMLSVLFLQAYGVNDLFLSETNDLRRQNYSGMSSLALHNPLEEELEPSSFDLVLDVVGINATRQTSMQVIKPGGVVMHFGLGDHGGNVDTRKLTLAEITLLGSYAYTMNDMRQAVKALENGSLGNLEWLEQKPLEEGQAAFEALLAAKVASPKIILRP